LLTEEVNRRLANPRYNLVPISSFEILLQYGCSIRATEEPVGYRILRMNNLQAEGWQLDDLKYVQLTPNQFVSWRLEPGDIVFNRTNSKELVGKCEVFQEKGDWVFASYLIRLRVDRRKALPEFVTAFLNTRAGRVQIDRESRQIIGMSNINGGEIRTLRVPLPGISEQNKLLTLLETARHQRKGKLTDAASLVAGLDSFVADQLGLTVPPTNFSSQRSWGVRLAETMRERRLDPHRFAPRTRELRQMVVNGKYRTLELSRVVDEPVSGVWGISAEERGKDTDYVECLVIRATEFDDVENLILDNNRVRFRFLERKSFDSHSLKPGDLILEKSGGGPLQPVGRVAVIEPQHLKDRNLTYTNFVMRLRPRDDVLPMYLWAFLGFVNRCGLTESMQAQTHGIRNLKLDEYMFQQVPIPPREVQLRIAAEVARRRDLAGHLRNEADIIWERAKADFENSLLGPSR
jgi:type I restriction enzyme, S subunit